jgi:hypothetical protein
MKINLSPQRMDAELEVFIRGPLIIVNGEHFDFTRMVAGDVLPASAVTSDWIIDKVNNVNGELELTLLLPLPANYSQEQAFPVPLLNVSDGPVSFPKALSTPEQVASNE